MCRNAVHTVDRFALPPAQIVEEVGNLRFDRFSACASSKK
jgi:hypothetical protein